jgi:hypothetical protein
MKRKRCKIAGAVEILGESERTIRNKAAAGLIPGAAKLFGTWSFDVALLHAFVAEKERETSQRAGTRAMAPVRGAASKPPGNSDFTKVIQKLRLAAKKRENRS